jgi:hypothetical protein
MLSDLNAERAVTRVWRRDDSENRMTLTAAVRNVARFLPDRPRRPGKAKEQEARERLLAGEALESPLALYAMEEVFNGDE